LSDGANRNENSRFMRGLRKYLCIRLTIRVFIFSILRASNKTPLVELSKLTYFSRRRSTALPKFSLLTLQTRLAIGEDRGQSMPRAIAGWTLSGALVRSRESVVPLN